MSLLDPAPDDAPGPDDPDAAGATLGLRVTQPRPDAVVLTASGEIDEATAAHLEEVLAPRLVAAVRMVVLDLSEVSFLGVPALQLLTRAHLRAREHGIELRLVATEHEVARALRIAKLDAVLSWYATTTGALAADPDESA
ncbi:STAS domain-containing protein [Haloactinomyces albus]|uniref:Anti-sigma factor antagonist n=1 Tax=Haloactinomyces albus TaxID=1352928 RepID=A0AAE3ZDX7_9ACTN|nr:STAS domain-containing protein [Haloactinomyces albus]MDR7301774.1 anti-anti-sigma factor [Haloactinomyces albus]